MSVRIFSFLALGVLICFCAASCDKKCTAGTGGNLTIVGFPQHHTVSIPNRSFYPDTVFLKFNTQDFPGSNKSNYDTYFVGTPGTDSIIMSGLKCGNYYIYSVGFDTSLHLRVTGGIPFTTTQKEGTVQLNIPVTE